MKGFAVDHVVGGSGKDRSWCEVGAVLGEGWYWERHGSFDLVGLGLNVHCDWEGIDGGDD